MRTDLSPAIPVEQWPAADKLAWSNAFEGDPLTFGGADAGGGAAGWARSTARVAATAWGHYLAWLQLNGALDPVEAPADRVTRDLLHAYRNDLDGCGYADWTKVRRLQGLADALRVMAPDSLWPIVSRAATRLSAKASRKKDYHSMRQPPEEILKVGVRLMAEAELQAVASGWTINLARSYRDGLLISLWICRPIRRANLAELTMELHVVGSPGERRIVLDGSTVKYGMPLNCSWPRIIGPPLETYLEVVRPVFVATAGEGACAGNLWLGADGALKAQRVAGIIKKRTADAFGTGLTTHLARHIVTTEIAERTPKNIHDVMAILQHNSMEPAQTYYNLAGPTHAAPVLAAAIRKIRRRADLGPSPVNRPGLLRN